MGVKARQQQATRTIQSARTASVSGGTGLISLLIVIHLVCISIALTSNLRRSSLQGRLIEILQPYLGLLNLDPDYTPYQLTHGQPLDDDHFVEVEIFPASDRPLTTSGQQGTPVTLEAGSRWGFSRRRYRRLAYVMAYHAEAENDHITAALARATASAALEGRESHRAIVRCKRHESQPRRLGELAAGFPEDPHAQQYQQTVYEADVWWAEGKLQVQKRVTRQESARLNRQALDGKPAEDIARPQNQGVSNRKE